MEFPARPVVFFQVVGTHNTANEVFHAVHFESPAQVGPEESEARWRPSPSQFETPNQEAEENTNSEESNLDNFDFYQHHILAEDETLSNPEPT